MNDYPFNLKIVHPSWHKCLKLGLDQMDQDYLHDLARTPNWLPGPEKIFNAFSMPIHNVNYVLFGESPYPRRESANGYAFWDAAVTDLWSETGLSKKVNRATSLRNLLKMLLTAEGLLNQGQSSQDAIAAVNKSKLIKTNHELFTNLLNHGFLLLNATPVLQEALSPTKDARHWQVFMAAFLVCLAQERPSVKFILLGNIANTIDKLIQHSIVQKLYAEHPYNISFITNPKVLSFFAPLHLLLK